MYAERIADDTRYSTMRRDGFFSGTIRSPFCTHLEGKNRYNLCLVRELAWRIFSGGRVGSEKPALWNIALSPDSSDSRAGCQASHWPHMFIRIAAPCFRLLLVCHSSIQFEKRYPLIPRSLPAWIARRETGALTTEEFRQHSRRTAVLVHPRT